MGAQHRWNGRKALVDHLSQSFRRPTHHFKSAMIAGAESAEVDYISQPKPDRGFAGSENQEDTANLSLPPCRWQIGRSAMWSFCAHHRSHLDWREPGEGGKPAESDYPSIAAFI